MCNAAFWAQRSFVAAVWVGGHQEHGATPDRVASVTGGMGQDEEPDDLVDVEEDYGKEGDEELEHPLKKPRLQKQVVSEEAIQAAFSLRDAVLRTWLWNPEKLDLKLAALTRVRLSVDLLERTGLPYVLKKEFGLKQTPERGLKLQGC